MLEELLDQRLKDDDYFEDEEERPSPATIALAKATIAALRPEDANTADIGFFWGEIFLDWEDETGDRTVKVMVTRQPETKIYFGRMENKRVVEHGLISGSTELLAERLDWMRAPKVNPGSGKQDEPTDKTN